jgi:hypothetical protein
LETATREAAHHRFCFCEPKKEALRSATRTIRQRST